MECNKQLKKAKKALKKAIKHCTSQKLKKKSTQSKSKSKSKQKPMPKTMPKPIAKKLVRPSGLPPPRPKNIRDMIVPQMSVTPTNKPSKQKKKSVPKTAPTKPKKQKSPKPKKKPSPPKTAPIKPKKRVIVPEMTMSPIKINAAFEKMPEPQEDMSKEPQTEKYIISLDTQDWSEAREKKEEKKANAKFRALKQKYANNQELENALTEQWFNNDPDLYMLTYVEEYNRMFRNFREAEIDEIIRVDGFRAIINWMKQQMKEQNPFLYVSDLSVKKWFLAYKQAVDELDRGKELPLPSDMSSFLKNMKK